MKYWAGSNIKKSESNAFNWRGSGSVLMKDPSMKRIEVANQQKQSTEPRYSGLVIAKARKING
jgi:hypothetical protein